MIDRFQSHLLVVAAALSFLFPPATASGTLIELELNQASFELGAQSQAFSDWGEALITFEGKSDFQYFNLVRDGQWVIENAPVISIEGANIIQSLSINFDLGNTPGDPFTSTLAAFSLTDFALAAPPTNDTPFTVNEETITVGGILGSPFAPGAGTPFLQSALDVPGWIPVDWAVNSGMVNQEVGVDECVPGGFSNSLMWLDDRSDKVDIPDDQKTIARLKDVVDWRPPVVGRDGKPIPNTGGATVEGIRQKAPEYEQYGVRTKEIGATDIDRLLAELKRGEDIEVAAINTGSGHFAVITCVIKHANGMATLCVTHDTEQGKAGGLKTQVIGYDPTDGTWTTNAYGFNAGGTILFFVDESPIPEPGTLSLAAVGFSIVLWIYRRQRRSERGGQPGFPRS